LSYSDRTTRGPCKALTPPQPDAFLIPFLIDNLDEIFAPVLALAAVFLDELPEPLAMFFVSEIVMQGKNRREGQLALRASYPSADRHVL
jgi:hypothetical protein